MALIDRLFERRRVTQPRKQIMRTSGGWGMGSRAGVPVNTDTALTCSSVYRAVAILATGVAKLPGSVVKEAGTGGHERMAGHRVSVAMKRTPNREQTPFIFKEYMTAVLALWGNSYAEIVQDNAGRALELWPLPPQNVTILRDKTNSLFYRYQVDANEALDILPKNILHLRLFGDGIAGKSIVSLARESMGLALATESHGAAFFGNGAAITGVLTHPNELSDTAHQQLRRDFEDSYRGVANAHRPAILEEGMDWKQIGIPNDDAQFLETRTFQVREIARWYGVPAHMLVDNENATFSNIEHQKIEFVTDTLMPWLNRWEQEIEAKLLGPELDYRFNTNALLRGDIAARTAFYREMRREGVFTANDILRLEDMNPIGPEGDIRLVESNMQVLKEDMGEQQPEPMQPQQPVQDQPEDDPPDDSEDDGARAVLVRDTFGRLLHKETTGLARLCKKHAGDALDAAVREFYQRFEDDVIAAFVPVWPVVFSGNDGGTEASRYVSSQREMALTTLRDGLPLQSLIDEWRDSRADQLTAMYFGGSNDGA